MAGEEMTVDGELQKPDIHSHCLQCIKSMKCNSAKSGESCQFINCPLDCGFRFHACKLDEHKLLCVNEKVPCINADYGCPFLMLRKHRSRHLESCPASIIHCSEEWDRWPIHLHDREAISANSKLDLVTKRQLDVALALRDQRMLKKWCIAAAQGQELSKQKFKPSSSVWVARRWQNSREQSHPPGLEESVCKELWQNTFNNQKTNSTATESANSENKSCPVGMETDSIDSNEDIENVEDDTNFNNKYHSESSTKNPDNLPTEYNFNLDDVLQLSQFGTIVYPKYAREGSLIVPVNYSEIFPYLFSGQKDLACKILDLKFRNPASTPPWCVPLGLDLNLESRCQHSPQTFMYTFLCGQEFRRDEYGWHYKNVHSEIHGGLSGWLLERCPLAQYGCKFSRRRFNPTPTNSSITYNESLESFGIAYDSPKEHSLCELDLNSTNPRRHLNSGRLNLTDLPFEVLQQIASFLDSFSLGNLSLTSTFLREVCASVLKDKGLVHFKWEKHKLPDDKIVWRRSNHKVWFFSTHFSPIHSWTIEDKNNMAHHLKTCEFFNRIPPKQPFHYLSPKTTLDDKFEVQAIKISQDNNTTKL